MTENYIILFKNGCKVRISEEVYQDWISPAITQFDVTFKNRWLKRLKFNEGEILLIYPESSEIK